MKCNQSRPGFELVSPCSFPTAIMTTPRAPPLRVVYGNKTILLFVVIWQFHSVRHVSSTVFHYKHGTFFYTKFHHCVYKIYDFIWYFLHFETVYYPALPFWNQSRLLLDVSAWSSFRWGCADLCQVALLCIWILCNILSIPQWTIRGLLASSKSLFLFVLLIGRQVMGL